MIWLFEEGPWDGKTIELDDGVLVPMRLTVDALYARRCTYELARKQNTTFIYRPASI
jgi:hypothetical protein